MAYYDYRAVTSGGRMMKGTLEAGSGDEARLLLGELGLQVHSVEASAAPPKPASPLGRNEFLLFNQQLASMAQAGIPLERGLRELARDVRSRPLREAVEAIAADLEAGQGIEQAFAARQRLFPPLYGHILQAGIRTGRLGEMLTSLNHHLEVSLQTRRMIVEALAYPLTVLALAVVIFSGVLYAIIPAFRELFADMEVRHFNWMLQTLFFLSDHLGAILAGGAGVVVLVVVGPMVLRRSGPGRAFLERLLLGLPVLGRLYAACCLGRLADSLALMVGTGCDLPACLRLGGRASGSELLIRDCDELAQHVQEGREPVEAGEGFRLTSRLFLYSLTLGCRRNTLADNLYGLSHMYDVQARSLQSMLQSVLTPLLLVLIGGVIGLIIAAMFQPLVGTLDALQKV